jgi:hypothetical protein
VPDQKKEAETKTKRNKSAGSHPGVQWLKNIKKKKDRQFTKKNAGLSFIFSAAVSLS